MRTKEPTMSIFGVPDHIAYEEIQRLQNLSVAELNESKRKADEEARQAGYTDGETYEPKSPRS